MALVTTTLTAAVGVMDKVINVTSATGFAAGNIVKIDEEMFQVTKEYVSGLAIPVLRGQDGSQQIGHPTATNVTVGLASDFASPGPGGPAVTYPSQRARIVRAYSAAGAITLPPGGQDMLAIINGTGALAMTLAVPTKDMDGCRITIVGNGKAAHTVTIASGLGNVGATADVVTFKADQAQGFEAIAMNGFWNGLGTVGGAATIAGVGIA